jgi:hypothetical protein
MRYANWLTVAAAAAVLAGCATAPTAPTGPRAAPAGQRAVPAADVAAHETPPQRAAADAAAMVAAFIPPPHAARTGPLPVRLLAQPVDQPLVGDLVTRTGWWRVAGQPQAVVSWIQAHEPPGFAFLGGGNGTGFVTARGTDVMWTITFIRPDVPGVLTERQLVATVAADGRDRVAIRLDAYSVWLPVRPAAETIPASAQSVTITPVAGEPAAEHQVTVTDPTRVARIAALVNALPVYPPRGPMWCDILLPLDGGPAMRLTFRTSAGRALAVVTAYQEECQLVDVVTGGKTMPALAGAQTLIQRAMAIAGIAWPDFPAPGPTATPTAGP